MIKTNGATFKRFYDDDSVWPEDSWHEDEEILINGEECSEGWSARDIPNDAIILLSGGVVYGLTNGTETSLELHFKRWLKRQTTVVFMVECSRDKIEQVKEAARSAGGKVL